MPIYLGSRGSGLSTAGALTIENNHIFVDDTERDAYFVSNPSELVEDLYVSTDSVLEKYVSSSWVDMSALMKGSTGSAGADGESAYQVAVDNGFVGTESEWLDSLKGTTVENAMSSLVYDPQGVEGDAFARANQTGMQAISTVTGLQTSLDNKALESDLTLVEDDISTITGVVGTKADQVDLDTTNSTVTSLTTTVGTKLDSSEYSATDVKSKYEDNDDTNAFTDAEKTKLAALVEGGTTTVQSDWEATSGDEEILNKPTLGTLSSVDDSPSDGTAYVREDGNWVLCDVSKVDGLQSELSSLEQATTDLTTVVGTKASDDDLTSLEGDVTSLTTVVSTKLDTSSYSDADVKLKYESNDDTNSFTDAYETKLNNLTDRFKGVFLDSSTRDAELLTPSNGDYCKQTDTNSFWFYGSGAWIDTGSSSTGDMLASIYDPQGIAQDSFDRSNHTGTQAISTVTGLQANLDTRALESDLTLVENDVSTLSTSVSGKLDAVSYTSADVKTKYESNLDTNVFTDAEQTKLAGIANGAEANVGEEYTLTEKTKLGLIESGAQVNVGEEYTTAAALAVIFVTGTGVSDSSDYRSSVNENWVVQQQVTESNEVSSQDMVIKVLSNFGLTVKNFEPILGVKRAAIYNWKKGANEPNEVQFQILKNLYQVATLLNSKEVKIGRLAKTNIYQGKSIIERLSSPEIEIESVVEHHNLLVSKVLKQNKTFNQVADERLMIEGDSFVSLEGKVT